MQQGNSPASGPDEVMEDSIEPPDSTQNLKRVRLPPIVDFTGYRPDTSNPAAYKESVNPRRSPVLSGARGSLISPSAEDYTAQIAAAAAAADHMQVDPVLLSSSQQRARPEYVSLQPSPAPSPSLSSEGRERWKTERRLTLMREAEMMRAALRQKEREIDELN